jgi:MoaA/NifB/PqqE/SkfB family radical SAM enzyme
MKGTGGAGTFDKTINSLKELHRRGVRLRINTLVDNKSVNDLEFMADLASQYALEINFFIVRFMGRGLNLEGTDSVTMEQFYEMAKQAEKIRQKYPKLNLLHFAQVTRERSINSGTHDKFGLKIGPPPGFSNFNVTYDGGLWAGGYTPYIDPSQRCGNIKNDDLFNVWQHSDTLEEYRDVARKLMLFCQKCPELGNKCSGPNYEIELYRLFNRKSENPYCLYGQGPSLLTKLK